MLTPDGVSVADYSDALALEEFTHARVTFIVDDIVFQDEELYQGGITVSTYMNPNNNMTFGVAYSTEVIVRFLRSEKTENLNFAREFTLEFGVDINGETKWVKIGHFTGKKSVLTTQDTIELTAYDKMIRFDRNASDFIGTMDFPATIGEIYEALCEFCVVDKVSGDEIASVMSRSMANPDDFKGLTCRELLAKIAEANCCYAKMTNEGDMQLKWFSDCTDDQTLLRDNCFDYQLVKLEKSYSKKWEILEEFKWKELESLQYSEYDNNNNPFDYSYVKAIWKSYDEEKEVTQPPIDEYYDHKLWANVENFNWENVEVYKWKEFETIDDIGGNTYTITNNPLVRYDTDAEIKAHLQLILDKLYDFHLYYVATLTMVGNWLIEPGDIVTLEVSDGVFTTYPIFNRVLNWNGSCECEYETTGSLSDG